MVNHYKTLGLNPDASASDIKKAYRKLALKYHPDKNQALEAVEIFRAVAAAYAVLGDEGRRKTYDGTGGADEGDVNDPDNVDPYEVFKQVFNGYTLREVLAEEMLNQLTAKIWLDRRVSVSAHVLRVSNAGARVVVASRRLSTYPVAGLAFGLSGLRGLASHSPAFRLFQDRNDQVPMSSALLGLGCMLGLGFSLRPVLHLDLAGGMLRAGHLKLWESDKPADELRVVAQTEKGGAISVPGGVMMLLNWLDYVNAEEQWKQFGASVLTISVATWPLTEHFERWSQKFSTGKAFLLQGVVVAASYGIATLAYRRLFRFLVDESANPKPPFLDRERPPRFGPFLPRQCKPSDFENFATSNARPGA